MADKEPKPTRMMIDHYPNYCPRCGSQFSRRSTQVKAFNLGLYFHCLMCGTQFTYRLMKDHEWKPEGN